MYMVLRMQDNSMKTGKPMETENTVVQMYLHACKVKNI